MCNHVFNELTAAGCSECSRHLGHHIAFFFLFTKKVLDENPQLSMTNLSSRVLSVLFKICVKGQK